MLIESELIGALADSVRAELDTPSGDRARVIAETGRRLLALPADCLDPKRIDALLDAGALAYYEGSSLAGLSMVKAAAGLAMRSGARPLQRKALSIEAALHSDLGDQPTAIESTVAAILLAREIADPRVEAIGWGNLAAVFSDAGDWSGALRCAERALQGDPDSVSALVNAAEASLELGQTSSGLRYARRCLDRKAGTLRELMMKVDAEVICGRLFLELEDLHRAVAHARAARAAAAEAKAARAVASVDALEGMCMALLGERKTGMRLIQRARRLHSADVVIGQERRRADRWLLTLYRKLGDEAAAREALADEGATMYAAAAERLQMAGRLGRSSGLELLERTGPGVALTTGTVFERFTICACSLQESSGAHCLRTAMLVRWLAEDHGCDAAEAEAAQSAARVHDLGKTCVMPEVLLKQGPRDAFEGAEFRDHAMRGAALLEASGELSRAAVEAVRHHHECWDGSGFPFALAGEAIPLAARLVGICEAFDEMIHTTAQRREPLGVRRALEELLRQRGRRFDPQLVDLLIERVRRTQREMGGVDEAFDAEADRSSVVLARRTLFALLECPAAPGESQ